MLELRQLNVFLEAAETANFTEAAGRLHMTQPSVSQQIRNLERQLGVELFKREGRQVALSDAGMALVPLARRLVNQAVAIEETMRSLQGEVYGQLHVGCSTTPGKYILPLLLTEFHRQYPQVRVACRVATQTMSLESLNRGEVQFALSSQPTTMYDHVDFQPFIRDEIVMIVPRQHRWAHRRSIMPAELPEGEYIFRESSSGTQTVVNETLAAAGVSVRDLNTLLVLGNSEAIALAVQEGLGVGFVSRIVVDRLVMEQVAIVPIEGVRFGRQICFGRYTGQPATNAQEAFWHFVNDNPNIYNRLSTMELNRGNGKPQPSH